MSRAKTFSCLLILAAVSALAGGCGVFESISAMDSTPPVNVNWRAGLDDKTAEAVEKSLALAGENRPSIEAFLSFVHKERLPAAGFLVAYMSPAALSSLSTYDLLSEFNLAYKARSEFQWCRDLPEPLFLHYVLPNFVAQEPYSRYREYFLPHLRKVVADCKDAREASMAINRWCAPRVGYVSTERRDRGVFECLKAGNGRCEEMCIFYISAARSVGIPARISGTPYWATTDSNHAWVEVYVNGKWEFLGASEPGEDLGRAWFTSAARRAPLVLSSVFGKLQSDEIIYRASAKSTSVNTTQWYSDTCDLVVVVTDDAGKPVAKCNVYLSVFNFGGFRPFAMITTDAEGKARLKTGIGEYIVSCSNDKKFAAKKVTTLAGKEVALEITPGKDDLPDGTFWLKYADK